jgi:hypothetical protein
MLNRIVFAIILLFWLTMNVLLWRSEFSRVKHPGSPVSVETVWQKMLTAPDDSSLEIFRQGKRVGRCRWTASAGEELLTGGVPPDEFAPEGQVNRLASYSIDWEGSVALEELKSQVRFSLHGLFSTNHQWQEFSLRVGVRPSMWEVRTVEKQQSVTLKVEDEDGPWERKYTFEELRNPQTLLRDFGAPGFLGFLGGPLRLPAASAITLGLKWEARNDWLKIGRSQVRTYRLQTHLLDRYHATVFVSRVGELLRVELPTDIVLVNEALSF